MESRSELQILRKDSQSFRRLIPRFDGAFPSLAWKDSLWDNFATVGQDHASRQSRNTVIARVAHRSVTLRSLKHAERGGSMGSDPTFRGALDLPYEMLALTLLIKSALNFSISASVGT